MKDQNAKSCDYGCALLPGEVDELLNYEVSILLFIITQLKSADSGSLSPVNCINYSFSLGDRDFISISPSGSGDTLKVQ